MPEKKKKEIAGVSYDKWLEEKRPKVILKHEPNKYSNKLIAFLDVLGIKSFIEKYSKGDEDIAIDKIEEIRKIVKTSTEILKTENFDYLNLSDSFVFICEPKEVILLIKLLATLQTRIITECNFQLRGAVTIGNAIIKEEGKFITGPAYIQAYQLQENDAIYPRIIVDRSITKKINETGDLPNQYLKQDLDKEYFIDYIMVYIVNESMNKKDMKINLRRGNVFNYLRDNFKNYYEDENHNISQKYGWTIQYYKEIGVWEDG